MKAIIFNETGNAKDVLSRVNIEKPICKNNEALIRMIKSPINPADLLFIAGKYRIKPKVSQIAGFEGVGIIEDIGTNERLSKGTLVAFRHHNVWAEYVAVPFENLTILPESFPIDKACQFSLNPITAQALIQESESKVGDWLVLTAGASSISKLIIQLSRSMGIKVISIVRDIKNADILKALSVDAILEIEDNIKEIIPDIVGNNKLHAVIDAVGGHLTSDLIKLISQNGHLLLYGLQSKDNVMFHNSDIIFKNLKIKGLGIDDWISKQPPEHLHNMKQTLINKIQKEDFIMPVDSTWNMSHFKEAFLRLESANLRGKVLLSFN